MTRTERASYPRALNRDRSESRTGLDPGLRKGGAGGHNWGSLDDEQLLESTAQDDEELELEEDKKEASTNNAGSEATHPQSPAGSSEASSKPPMERSTSGTSVSSSAVTEEDRENARKLRKNAFKKSDQLDLTAIARSSAAVSGSPPDSDLARRLGSDNRQVSI
ncbi:hypothetical protein D9756_008646 [Leucocoprinus leucothites]|uniref:Hyaluronan/mRNA-binding protein domain-containing protein n=1 Tax=Leucocoprinus leucothites TaxID=201217 RepID=A0A8H5FVG1_9AGAR|nr:hypothetical protein D9756_008646 [Leucoagaricus leucothites]